MLPEIGLAFAKLNFDIRTLIHGDEPCAVTLHRTQLISTEVSVDFELGGLKRRSTSQSQHY
ncbi:hypothetical protein M514_04132 [Trichuris suis]|uniref:Uncharacterized protein n=1 Tax=Trichuris suis TaxID=68888 RepID=A0A085NG31_9BILA|nr:hypothetical protein M513_04132 [Trichuris suis]KFD68427.1 hypothetical protein M514_04132 [Trichuris suis]KHJ47678.1 hypothetical protein D918_01834 [Trichuris suis]